MKTKIIVLLISALSLFLSSSVYSQIKLVIGPQIGLTSPTVDYSGETTDFFNGTKYGLRSGFNYGLLAKLAFGPLNAKGSISYVSMSNTGLGDPDKPNSTLEVKNNIFLITLGTEFGFSVPLSPIRPYAGIDLLISTMSGSFNFQGTDKVTTGEISIQSATRTGLGFNIGAEFKLGKSSTIDLSAHYNLLNLFGKDYKSGGTTRTDAYTSLNDAADPLFSASDPKHPIGNNRSIATIQVQLALLFGL